MAELGLGEGVINDPGGDGVTVSVTMFFAPGSAGTTVSLRDYFEWQGDAMASGEVLQITDRQPDGSDVPIPAQQPPIGSFTSTGIAFDQNMSSATYGLLSFGAFAVFVFQVIVVP